MLLAGIAASKKVALSFDGKRVAGDNHRRKGDEDIGVCGVISGDQELRRYVIAVVPLDGTGAPQTSEETRGRCRRERLGISGCARLLG